MEWVETTGKTVEDAKERALDQLGVDEQDAEFEILEEPRPGLFGRLRGEARVRARVQPRRPRPKVDRRERRRRSSREGSDRTAEREPRRPAGARREGASKSRADAEPTSAAPRPRRRRGGLDAGKDDKPTKGAGDGGEGNSMSEDVTVDQQAAIIQTFLAGLVDAFGLEGNVVTEKIDDETVEVQVLGQDLGLMIGPKGQTLQCIQELARTVVQRQATGTHHGRVRIDVGQYRQRRREALERFAHQVAEQVRSSGVQKALEPMGSADRKVVHDTVNELEGVSTISEGQDPYRRVIILPDGD